MLVSCLSQAFLAVFCRVSHASLFFSTLRVIYDSDIIVIKQAIKGQMAPNMRQMEIIVTNQEDSLGHSLGQSLGQARNMERAEARKLGLRRYRTGRPCRNGHMAERYSGSATCVECLAEYQARLASCRTEAQKLLMQGRLEKEHAQALGSPWYCNGWGLPCGHIAHQRVADDACRMCLDNQELDLDHPLLS